MSTRNFRLSQVSLSLLAILGLDGQTNYCQVWLKNALKIIYCDWNLSCLILGVHLTCHKRTLLKLVPSMTTLAAMVSYNGTAWLFHKLKPWLQISRLIQFSNVVAVQNFLARFNSPVMKLKALQHNRSLGSKRKRTEYIASHTAHCESKDHGKSSRFQARSTKATSEEGTRPTTQSCDLSWFCQPESLPDLCFWHTTHTHNCIYFLQHFCCTRVVLQQRCCSVRAGCQCVGAAWERCGGGVGAAEWWWRRSGVNLWKAAE